MSTAILGPVWPQGRDDERWDSGGSGDSTFKRRLPAHSTRWCTLLEMRQNGLDDVRIGNIRDHPGE